MTPPDRQPADEIAEALRDESPTLDEVTQARMERALIAEAARAATTRSKRAPGGRRSAPRRALLFGVGGALAAAAAALLVFSLVSDSESSDLTVAETPSFVTFQDGETVGRGALAEGETIVTGEGQRVQVVFGPARVDVTPRSRALFPQMLSDASAVRLERGAVEVELHPERRGEQTLSVETPTARVEVVGTVFRVEVDADGATEVSVTEGTVRVVPHTGRAIRLVNAGQRTRVEPALAVIEPEADRAAAAAPTERVEPVQELDSPTRSAATRGETGSELAPAAEAANDDEQDRDLDHDFDEQLDEELEVLPAQSVDDRGVPLNLDARFDLAESYLGRGDHRRGRHILYSIARSPARRAGRVRAWTLLAESFSAQGNHLEAAESYRRAAEAGGGSLGGQNALYALARLRERRMGDRTGARAAYRRYLQQAPNGAHADLCRQALCRLGDSEHCREEGP